MTFYHLNFQRFKGCTINTKSNPSCQTAQAVSRGARRAIRADVSAPLFTKPEYDRRIMEMAEELCDQQCIHSYKAGNQCEGQRIRKMGQSAPVPSH